MLQRLKRFESALFVRAFKRPPSSRLGRNTFRFFLLMIVSMILWIVIPKGIGTLFGIGFWCFFVLLFLGLTWLTLRWIFSRVLWTVRSRLIVTCLLMGLAPIVLFGILTAIAAYLFCGQFATSVAAEGIKDRIAHAQERSVGLVRSLALTETIVPPTKVQAERTEIEAGNGGASDFVIATWRDGRPFVREPARAQTNGSAPPMVGAPAPAWLRPGFKGVLIAGRGLYLCGASGAAVNSHQLMALACSPFREREVTTLAEGLGKIRIMSNLAIAEEARARQGAGDGAVLLDDDKEASKGPREDYRLQGGTLPAPANFFDVAVYFSAPLDSTDWTTGEYESSWLTVISRPALLYSRLFSSSVSAGRYVKLALIGTGILFGLLELLALVMAVGLIRTITRSVADMYVATRQIDLGNLDHTIPVRRKDQLSALAASFNKMTASLKGLLAEQREKDRMQNELLIAQEVQKNLFPHTAINLAGFEVYGICEPARTVGGDYYDFIPFGNSQLYLTLGDISGKGISAALLMASLHSAVRAYRDGEESHAGLAENPEQAFSPGRLLALLNGHLYSSTQASKYATLFLACYDNTTRLLTYSNGGHLPPVLLCANGEVKHLDCGGSVVGLLPGMTYDEATVQLSPGDLIIAYSDGVTEPERETVEFGEEQLIKVVRRNQILGLADIAGRTISAVQEWIGEAEQPDDMTLVLARLS